MTPSERFALIREIFLAARELPPGEKRAALLTRRCALDGEIRAEVESLLAADVEGGLLSDPADNDATPNAPLIERSADGPSTFPKWVGRYRLLALRGEGGMGVVFKAEQRDPVRRVVALKLIRPGWDTKEVVARFDSERQALARMDHPNIAKVLDAGADEGGSPYFVMEYVPGVPITEFADTHRLTLKDRLLLFVQVCEAIAHAHTKAIIHRDIKPGNVLAYVRDRKPCVKVIDFGIAKALTADRLTEQTFATAGGAALGTYEYMSPEQAEGSPDIDTRTDVYSLGVLLYELLAGVRPFDRQAMAKNSPGAPHRPLRELEPPRPSTRLSALRDDAARIAAARGGTTDGLCRELRRELEWIPLKALRRERDRRYGGPDELKRDVENYLGGRALIAAPDGWGYRFAKGYRRNRGVIGASAAITGIAAAHLWWPWFLGRDDHRLGAGVFLGVLPWTLVYFGLLQAALRVTRIEPGLRRQLYYLGLVFAGVCGALALRPRRAGTR